MQVVAITFNKKSLPPRCADNFKIMIKIERLQLAGVGNSMGRLSVDVINHPVSHPISSPVCGTDYPTMEAYSR